VGLPCLQSVLLARKARLESQVGGIAMPKRTLGLVVRVARDDARMTQRDLAAAIGLKASHVAYIENGRRPSISLINLLSETLGVDAKELLVLAHPEAKKIVLTESPSGKRREGLALERGAQADESFRRLIHG